MDFKGSYIRHRVKMIAELVAIQLIESFSSTVYRSEHLVNDYLIIVSKGLCKHRS